MYSWVVGIAKIFLYAVITSIVLMLILWAYLYVQSNIIIGDRISDLVNIVASDNSLSEDGVNYNATPKAYYEQLLKTSETKFFKFNISADTYSDGYAVYVGNGSGTAEYYSFLTAPQRGSAITVKLQGELRLPILFLDRIGNANNSDEIISSYFTIPMEKTHIVMGLRFFKGRG